MDLTALVPSVDFCKRLCELGVTQKSFFFWGLIPKPPDSDYWSVGSYREWFPLPDHVDVYSAFTVTELDIMLGNKWQKPRLPMPHEISRSVSESDPLIYIYSFDLTEFRYKRMADAYASLLLRLIESEQQSVDQVNIRLKRTFPKVL